MESLPTYLFEGEIQSNFSWGVIHKNDWHHKLGEDKNARDTLPPIINPSQDVTQVVKQC